MHLSRREFLNKTSLAAACVGTVPSFAAAAAESSDLPIVVFTKVYQSLNLDFEDAASLTAEASLNGVDLPLRPGGEVEPEKAVDELPRYAAALRQRGLSMPFLTTSILSPSSAHAAEILRTAKKLGVKLYRTGFVERHSDESAKMQITEVRAQLKDLAAMNKEIGIGAIVQNHSPAGHTYLGGDLHELVEVLAGFNPNEIGAAFDIGHAIKVHGDEWRPLFEKLKPHLKVAYVKDTNRKGSWVRFGQGEVGKTGYFKLLRESGYKAPVCMHIEFDWAAGGKKTRATLLETLKESTNVLRGWLQNS